MFYVGRYDTAFSRFLSWPSLVALGDTSYSIYLVHTWTLRIFLHPAQPQKVVWAIDATMRVAFGIAITLLVSYATYRLVEDSEPHVAAPKAWRGHRTSVIRSRYTRQKQTAAYRFLGWPHTSSASPKASASQVAFSIAAILVVATIVVAGQAVHSNHSLEGDPARVGRRSSAH